MFSSTVMCGKRLNCWKTIPISARIAVDLAAGRVRPARPSKRIVPASIDSRPLMQRSIVDLPEPDGPGDDNGGAAVDLEVDPVEDQVVAEALA